MNNLFKPSLNRSLVGENFIWGVATSAFQIEGCTKQDGRGDSIWDTFCRLPGKIADGSDGTIACNHYNLWESDLDLISDLGVSAYRFSMSWSRVRPKGYGNWNEKGFSFYEKLIQGLCDRGIQPHLTLNHWDLPQALQDEGGWLSDRVCDLFVEYALEVNRRFGSKLASICTHNEPWVIAILGHEIGNFAPGLKSRKTAMQVSHNLLKSHGEAVFALRKEGCTAKLGIVLNMSPIYPATSSEEDVAKARLDDGLIVRWYMDSLMTGIYPQDVLEHLGDDAPKVADGDLQLISQPNDFIGLNYYTRNFSSNGNPWDAKSTGNLVTDMGWEVYPQGLTELLVRLNSDYEVKEFWVTENGAAFKDKLEDGVVDDCHRLSYLRDHIDATAKARELGVPVEAYFAWSLFDNFEWASGYEKRFGIYHVDYKTGKRTAKSSAYWYRDFLMGNSR